MFHCSVINVPFLLSFSATCLDYHIWLPLSTTFLNFLEIIFFSENSKRRRRDLNPRAAINDLLPFQGSPFGQLGYFSRSIKSVFWHPKTPYLLFYFALFSNRANFILIHSFLFVKHFFDFLKSFFTCLLSCDSGESGIRTHAPLRTNGFQDRLVMTTSISLQLYCLPLMPQSFLLATPQVHQL